MRYAFLLGAALLAATSSITLAGEGERFGSRDPAICPSDTSYPRSGPIYPDQVAIYLRCENEYYNTHDGDMYLAEFGPITDYEPRAFDYNSDPSAADSDQPVQDIAMSYYSTFICSPSDASNAGTNCVVLERDEATGECFKTRQGNWRCIVNYDPKALPSDGMAPPQ